MLMIVAYFWIPGVFYQNVNMESRTIRHGLLFNGSMSLFDAKR